MTATLPARSAALRERLVELDKMQLQCHRSSQS